MAERRQGECPNCPHDIIDPRDLKPYRNVCGYWFRREDDHFRWRDGLRFARAGLAELIVFSLMLGPASLALLLLALLAHWGFTVPLAITALLWAFVISFFRDPSRKISSDPNDLVSPADGTVTHVGEVVDPDFPGGRAFRISIFLSIFNVHVNRSPRRGRVVNLRYFPGRFLDARNTDCVRLNEQLWVDLEETASHRPVRVKQISGAIARRIVCWLKPGDVIEAGERFGMIKFGSRTDLLIPMGEPRDVRVQVGDKVKGGSTVLLKFLPAQAAGPA
jgi:phosphatidylserine decarboxylase